MRLRPLFLHIREIPFLFILAIIRCQYYVSRLIQNKRDEAIQPHLLSDAYALLLFSNTVSNAMPTAITAIPA